jgi:hypothetical protein
MNTKPHQLEIKWVGPESFALVTQTALDGDRVVREAAQKEADQLSSAKQQFELTHET